MSESDFDTFKRELELRKVRSAGQKLLKGQELYDFLGIREREDNCRIASEALYRHEYKDRVDVAYQMLLDKAGARIRELKPRFVGRDKFNPAALMRSAQRLVRLQHQQSLARIDERELKESKAFLEKSSQRRAYIAAFTRSASSKAETSTQRPDPSPSPSD